MTLQPPTIPVISDSTGELLTDEQATSPQYWSQHILRPVRFADAVTQLREMGVNTCIELGPDPVLTAMMADQTGPSSVATLRTDRPEPHTALLAAGHLHTRGVEVDWAGVYAGRGARRVPLPTYAFQRQRFWLSSTSTGSDAGSMGLTSAQRGLLSAVIDRPDTGALTLTGRFSMAAHPWLADHAVVGVVLVPGTGLVEFAVRAGDEVSCPTIDGSSPSRAPLVLAPDDHAASMSSSAQPPGPTPDPSPSPPVAYTTRSTLDPGRPRRPHSHLDHPHPDRHHLAAPGATPIDLTNACRRLAKPHTASYGPAFQGLHAVWVHGDDLYAEVHVHPPG